MNNGRELDGKKFDSFIFVRNRNNYYLLSAKFFGQFPTFFFILAASKWLYSIYLSNGDRNYTDTHTESNHTKECRMSATEYYISLTRIKFCLLLQKST